MPAAAGRNGQPDRHRVGSGLDPIRHHTVMSSAEAVHALNDDPVAVNDSALRVVLGLPEHVRPDILIGVGHPATKPSPAAVSRTPRGRRSNNRAPSSSSRSMIRRFTAEAVTLR